MRILATLLLTALLCLPAMADGQDEVVTGYDCECLIDGVSVKQSTLPPDGVNTAWQIDGVSLSDGMHQVQMRIVQHLSSGISAVAVYESMCYRIGAPSSHEVTATCRIDGQVYKTATVPTNGVWTTWTLDLNDIPEGMHLVNVVFADKNRDGLLSTTSFDAMCYRPANGANHDVTATCWVDGEVVEQKKLSANGESQTWTLDLSDMPVGLHQVRVDIVDKDKQGFVKTSRYQAMCCRVESGESHEVTAAFYVDGKLVKEETIRTGGEVQTCMLNLSNLPQGTYNIRVEIVDKDSWGFSTINLYESEFYCLGFEIYDLNDDGSINIVDVSVLLDAIFNDNQDEKLDVNGDGVVNISDINMIIAYILS